MKKLVLVTAFLFIGFGAYAQKIGHVSALEIIASMSDKKSADKQIETLTKKFEADLKAQENSLQKKFQDLQTKAQQPGATQDQLSKWQQEMQADGQNLEKKRKEAYQAVEKKRSELLEPIFKKAQSAINKVASSQGINYVIDSSRDGVILYNNGGNDLTSAVKKELGIL